MLLAFVDLPSDERLACFAKDSFLGEALLDRIPTDFHAGWKLVEIFRKVMIQEGGSRFKAVCHFCAITQSCENSVRHETF